ncbi:SRPBCC family protein [Kiritimatiellaeota bacterium B1221]|nr:SRPBCC family protein [Kiritimatiellaeota bacterium B1221]
MNATTSSTPTFQQNESKTTVLHTSQWLPRPIEEIFEFFSRPENLQRLTPKQLQFEILTPSPIEMKAGAQIDYKLKVHGIPLQWRSLISNYHPPHSFTDEQLKGPYKTWIHSHRFFTDGEGTRVEDHVTFSVPGGRLVEKLIVQKDLASIFSHRHKVLNEIFT